MNTARNRTVRRPEDLTPEALRERALRKIIEGQSELVRAEIAIAANANDWVEQKHSPLGRRKHLQLAREGAFPSQKHGKRVLVRRADLNAYIEKHGIARGEQSETEEVDDILDTVVGGGR